MPVRTLNYTNRKRIRREDALIALRGGKEGIWFDAQLNLSDYELPDDAHVYVEAYRSTTSTYMRFDFGQVGALRVPEDRKLQDFEFPEAILFRVKVVTASKPHGLLLAEADRIRPRHPEEVVEGVRPLLECERSRDLGNEVWKLDFKTGSPVILLNANVVNVLALENDPVFTALVAPVALRTVLQNILTGERDWDDLDDSENWRSQWIYFVRHGLNMPAPPDKASEDEYEEWIDDATRVFCERTNAVDLFNGHYWTGVQDK